MASKIFLFVACLAAVKELNGAVVIPGTCNLKVRQLQSQIGVAASQSRFEINSANTNIKTGISSAALNINAQLNVLQNRANAVAGPNAQLCKNKLHLDLAQVNGEAPKLCFPNAGINAINLKVNQLNRLKGDASLICDTCGQLYPLPSQVDELNNCVDSGIEGIANQGADLQAQISSDSSALEEQAVQCAQDAESAQLKIIDDASANFDACVGTP